MVLGCAAWIAKGLAVVAVPRLVKALVSSLPSARPEPQAPPPAPKAAPITPPPPLENRLARVFLPNGGSLVKYAFDQADRPTLMSFSNGVSCQQIFNERDGLLSKRYLRGGSPLFSVKYAYNQLGQRKLEEKKTSNWTKSTRYAYNKRRELSNSYRKVNRGCTIETSYAYDLNHNRIKKDETRYSSNANDQLTGVRRPSQTLAYNTAGQAVTAGGSTYTYSYSDQIKTVNTGAHQAAYVYDGNGQRVQKSVDGVISRFLWAGSEIVKEYTGSGDVKAQYFLGGGRTAIKHGGKWNFYLTDGLGSTVMLADHRGRSVATWDYDDYGETTQTSGSATVYNPFLYTGQELDKETGFYHLRARHYAPSLGKFLSRDPIGYAGGPNLYSYCAGDPINFTDPDGLLQRDANGQIIFTPYGKPYVDGQQIGGKQVNTTFQPGYVTGDDGVTRITVLKNVKLPKKPYDKRYNSNCFGDTFADGKFWIMPSEANKIIDGDRWQYIRPSQGEGKLQGGDVAIYDAGGIPLHSMTVLRPPTTSNGTPFWNTRNDASASGKNGPGPNYVGPVNTNLVTPTDTAQFNAFGGPGYHLNIYRRP